MNEIGKIKGLKDKTVEVNGPFNIFGDVVNSISMKPVVGDVEMFTLMKKEMSEADVKRVTKVMVDMVQRANPDFDRGDIETFITLNYGLFMKKLAILFGFATEKQIDSMLQKQLGEVEGKETSQ